MLDLSPPRRAWPVLDRSGAELARARWDADGVRDDLRGYLTGQIGDPDAVLVAGETGDLKKGTTTVAPGAPLAADPPHPAHRAALKRELAGCA